MLKSFYILGIIFLTFCRASGQINEEDYKVYSNFIKSEIIDSTLSVIVFNKLENDTAKISWVIDAIQSKNASQLESVRFMARDEEGNSIRSIDTATQNLIEGFYLNHARNDAIKNFFDLKVKVFLITKSPFKKHTKNGWKKFYKKYPGSGGLFTFSNIYYSQDSKTAIFYTTLSRNGLNGYGALTIMVNVNGLWKLKYKIYLWQS